MTDLEALAECWKEEHEEVKKNWGENKKSKVEELENLKQKLERNKEFSVIEVIEQLEQENAELKAEIGLHEATIEEQLKDKVTLYKQIEKLSKLKDWANCKNNGNCSETYCVCDKWELAE